MSKEEAVRVFEMTSKAEQIAQETMVKMKEAGVYPYTAIIAVIINCVFGASRSIDVEDQVEMLSLLSSFIDERIEILETEHPGLLGSD